MKSQNAAHASSRRVPPLSPVLIAGIALAPVPLALLQPFLMQAVRSMRRRHAELFERLGGQGRLSFLIDPVDLPFAFLLSPVPDPPSLRAIDKADLSVETVNATIRGPLLSLLSLLEGRSDGDALFFARELTIEGDMESVLALRNAIDGTEIDIVADIFPGGAIAGPARGAVRTGRRLFARFAEDLETVAAAVRAPVDRQSRRQAAELHELGQRLDDVNRKIRRLAKAKT